MTKQILVIDTEDDMYSSLLERRFKMKIDSGEYLFTYVDSPKSAWNMILATETTGWVPYPIPDDVLMHTRMHLTRDQVSELIPILINFVETGEVKV